MDLEKIKSSTPVEPWLSVEEIARHLGVSKESVYRWLEAGRIPAHRVGRQWRFKVTEVDNWVLRGHASDLSDAVVESSSDSPFDIGNKQSLFKEE